jgi:uncharacterized protein (TIGR00369 family)
MINKSQKERALKAFERNPYVNLIGMELVDLEYGEATLRMKMRKDLEQIHGLMHGGATASLIDTATGYATASVLDKGEKAATIDLTISYLHPVTKGTVTCTAKVIKNGRRFITLTAEAKNDEGKLVATALTTYTKVS